MKMEPIMSSETSEIRTQTPRNYPKWNKLQLNTSYTIAQIYITYNSSIEEARLYKLLHKTRPVKLMFAEAECSWLLNI